jgi:hypothetical protein
LLVKDVSGTIDGGIYRVKSLLLSSKQKYILLKNLLLS